MKMNCPRCRKSIVYSSENPFRPFCSQRCRDIDLGKWIEGQHSIAGEVAEGLAGDNSKPETPDVKEDIR